MVRALALFIMLLGSGVASAGIHDACHTDNNTTPAFSPLL